MMRLRSEFKNRQQVQDEINRLWEARDQIISKAWHGRLEPGDNDRYNALGEEVYELKQILSNWTY